MLLDCHILVLTHVEIGVLHLALKQTQRDNFSVICRGNHQISWVESDTFNSSLCLKYLSFEKFLQPDGVQDCNYTTVEAHHDVAIVIGSVFQSADSAFLLFEYVDRARFLSRSIVDHNIGATITVKT